MNDDEERLCQWISGNIDKFSFYGLLITAMIKADLSNLAKLEKGFPELVEAIYKYKTKEGYWEKLSEEYNEQK